ncbi:hypothetical protein L2729_06130 [Shewanella gelidimarina]|uniref:hypothetical protein n=1 Tax=Shewanella gelidimarina TaxID=56813 RepID=UPI00200E5ADA|nr:hypothetical protein [Shewanella gelidimarina]MCL1057576.1 hypothetical protein [Shewanella gelidimarina]
MRLSQLAAVAIILIPGSVAANTICQEYTAAHDANNQEAIKIVDYKVSKQATLIILKEEGQDGYNNILNYSLVNWNGDSKFTWILHNSANECNIDPNAELGAVLAKNLINDFNNKVVYTHE